jgi:hypothetical protein
VSDGGRCVGQAGGNGPGEECAIAVGRTGHEMLSPCAAFDTNCGDFVTLPDSDTSGRDFGGNDGGKARCWCLATPSPGPWTPAAKVRSTIVI